MESEMPAEISDTPRLTEVRPDSAFSLIEILAQIFAGGPGYEGLLDGLLDGMGKTR